MEAHERETTLTKGNTMKIANTFTEPTIENLDWVAELEDIDHNICQIALDAKAEILRLSRIIEKFHESAENDRRTR